MDNNKTQPEPMDTSARDTRELMRSARKASLATLQKGTSAPYVSLVTVATTFEGAPILLLSDLAVHTHNLKADPRASLLFDGTDAAGDPMAGGRVTVMGKLALIPDDAVSESAQRFLARHPTAAGYATFADFGFYALEAEKAHFIGGFGRIVDLLPSDFLIPTAGVEELKEAELGIIEHMNEDHASELKLYAEQLFGHPPHKETWKMIGMDADGMDLTCGGKVVRLPFIERVTTPQKTRIVLKNMANLARQKPPPT